jgi:hypothetical protein
VCWECRSLEQTPATSAQRCGCTHPSDNHGGVTGGLGLLLFNMKALNTGLPPAPVFCWMQRITRTTTSVGYSWSFKPGSVNPPQSSCLVQPHCCSSSCSDTRHLTATHTELVSTLYVLSYLFSGQHEGEVWLVIPRRVHARQRVLARRSAFAQLHVAVCQ